MNCILFRHGIAVERDEWKGADGDRPLTEKGKQRVRDVAAGLSRLDVQPTLVWSSPLIRALETAKTCAALTARTCCSRSGRGPLAGCVARQANDGDTNPEVTFDFGKPVAMNVADLREFLPAGQRVDAFGLDRWDGSKWVEFAAGTSIGNRRLLRFETVTTGKVRLRISKAAVCPALSEVGFYLAPEPNK